MISKAGSRTYERTQCPPRHPRLSPMERCLLKWAVIDRDDRVLDVGLGNGLMAEYLLRNMECEVCGVADDMELVRSTRGLVRSADLVYAAAGDIPWRDQAFHTVLLRPSRMDGSAMENQLREVHRVLKEGGQQSLSGTVPNRGMRIKAKCFFLCQICYTYNVSLVLFGQICYTESTSMEWQRRNGVWM